MMMMMKVGVAKQIMNRVLTIPRKHRIQLRKDMGSVSSTVEISWEHIIRRDGVLVSSYGILDFLIPAGNLLNSDFSVTPSFNHFMILICSRLSCSR